MRRRHRILLASALLLLPAVAIAPATAIAAETPGPGWEVISTPYPTDLPPGGAGFIEIAPLNVGAADSAGVVTVTDTLPPGVTATDAGEQEHENAKTLKIGHEFWHCAIAPGTDSPENSVVTCHNDPVNLPTITGGAGAWTGPPGHEQGIGRQPRIAIAVEIAAGAEEGSKPNLLEVSGGGAPTPLTATDPLTIGAGPPPFGFARWDGWFSNADGTLDTRAGSVPYSATFSLDLNNVIGSDETGEFFPAAAGKPNRYGEPRSFLTKLPPGFVGNPQAVSDCTLLQLNHGECPPESELGFVSVPVPFFTTAFPVYNMAPPPGVAAELGFSFESISTFLDAGVRTGADYGIDTRASNVAQLAPRGVTLTLWGVPHDPSHNAWRLVELSQRSCSQKQLEPGGICNLGPHPELKPFLRLPTSCSSPAPFSIWADTWLDPETTAEASFLTHDANGEPTALTGCNQLPFDPKITSKPTTDVADAPSGLDFDLHIPQPEIVNPIEAEAKYPFEAETPGETRTVGAEPARHEADLKNAVVTLPKGVSVNPSSANGLGACTAAQIGLTSPPGATPITTTSGPATCPDAAKIGSVEVDTPLLEENPGDHSLKGAVYIAKPLENPFGSLLAIYIAVNDPETGTVVKLAGQVEADPVTGQLKTTFANNPQIPFEDFHLNFFGGAHAALRTPSTCGRYETTSQMTPWSTPEGADAFPSDSFETIQAPGGGACPTSEAQLPNKLTYSAGTITPKAGIYSPAVAHLARADGSQQIKLVDGTLPEGLLAKLAGVSECSDAQIAAARTREHVGGGHEEIASPSCPLNSEVGVLHVGAGAGPDPYYVTGKAYLAGPYKGAPISGVAIVPAVAGPYDLGTVVNRAPIYINPETGQARLLTDEIPQIRDGIPLDVRSIDLNVNRPQFTLNPTSCEKKAFTLSAPAALSVPFQVGECSKLGFAPKLAIKLKGGVKRNDNPALTATVTYPQKGAYSNVAFASVALPHSEFLDQAHIKTICTRVQFAEGAGNGERCPPASIYGYAKATTPLLDNPVQGPVYLRSSSHNLPDLVAALNGQINVVLDGRIDTDKEDGIRNSFDLVPDAPVTKFTLSMQGGKKGLLVNSENICRKPQKATVRFTAQNGKTDNYKPTIANSCKTKAKKHKKHHGGGR